MMITFEQAETPYISTNGDVLWGATAEWAKPDPDERDDWLYNPDYRERVSGLKLNMLSGTEFEDNEILLVCHVNVNPMKAMEILDIDQDFFCPQTDPYTGYKVFGIMPVAVLSDDISKYRERCRHVQFPDLIFDQGYIKETIGGGGRIKKKNWRAEAHADIFELTDIQEQMMGSGYTDGCGMNDGDHARIPAKVKISNGDWLFVWFWEWYNK